MIRVGVAALRAWGRGRGWAAFATTAPPAPPTTPEPRKEPPPAVSPSMSPAVSPAMSPVVSPVVSPVLRSCPLPVSPPLSPLQAWVGSLRHPEDTRRGLADLHPEVFGVTPRLDILHAVATWQRNYKRISHARVRSRAEVRGGGRKPWRQKGSGRARHGSRRSPLWRGGGIAHGPRGPTSYFFLPPLRLRALGLRVALSAKLGQDELHLVENLELPTRDPRYLQELARFRRWGSSVLLVDLDEFPESVSAAAEGLKRITLIPALGLNVHSLLKHQTLVLTLAALEFLERRLLWHQRRHSALYPFNLPYRDLPWDPPGGPETTLGGLRPPWGVWDPSGGA